MKAAANQVASRIEKVHPDLVKFFTPAATKLLEKDEISAVDALASAFATISGFDRPPARKSIITAQQGIATMQLTIEENSRLDGRRTAAR